MSHLTDIEIAQQTTMLPITQIAAGMGIDEKYVEPFGKYKAKIATSRSATSPASRTASSSS
ncbi:MAG: formate--tetrahydrofolate ligase [Eubacteriales bacterium]